MSGIELKLCPFCGGDAIRHNLPDDEYGNSGGDVIECSACLASSQVEFGFKENLVSAWNRRTPDPAQIRADALRAAGREYILEHVMETDWHRQGRHSAIRGMMVRMGLYAELEAAIDEAIAESATPLSPTAVDGSPAPDAGSKEGV